MKEYSEVTVSHVWCLIALVDISLSYQQLLRRNYLAPQLIKWITLAKSLQMKEYLQLYVGQWVEIDLLWRCIWIIACSIRQCSFYS